MSTREVEDIVRQSYVDELDTVAVPASLLSRVTSIPDASRGRPVTDVRRFMLIAAVAVLSTAALGLALAVGGGLPRPPITADATESPTPGAVQTARPPEVTPSGSLTVTLEDGYCGRPLPDGVVLQFVTSRTETESIILALFDGTVLVGERERLFHDGMRVRRLTEAGLAALAELVSNAGVPHCQRVPYGQDGESGWLTARTGSGDIAVAFGSGSERAVRPVTPAELTGMHQLAAGLQDLDNSIPQSSWRDTSWGVYVPERWRLHVWPHADEMPTSCQLGKEPTPSPAPSGCLPWASGITLPNGTPLLSFGTLYPGHTQGGYPLYRCGIVDRTTAEQIESVLALRPGDYGPHGRSWSNAGDALHVSLNGMLPGDAGCEPPTLAAELPDPAPKGVLTDVDPCAVMRGAVDSADLSYFPKDSWTYGAPHWWIACRAYAFDSELGIRVRGQPTSASDGASYATSLFGEGIESEQLAGRTIFWNGCFRSAAHTPTPTVAPREPLPPPTPHVARSLTDCSAAAAVVSEPHLVIFTWLGDHEREDLRAIIARTFEQQLIP